MMTQEEKNSQLKKYIKTNAVSIEIDKHLENIKKMQETCKHPDEFVIKEYDLDGGNLGSYDYFTCAICSKGWFA